MTPATPTPVERVVAILVAHDYRPAPKPLVVASVPFDFAAALVGVGRAPDLIVVIDTIVDTVELRLRQKVEGLARALDVAGSRRPMTCVLVGPKPSDPTLEALSRLGRVLAIGTPTGPEAEALLHDWLAVLLPLPLPPPGQSLADPRAELIAQLPDHLDGSLRKSLLAAADEGPKAVEQALKKRLDGVLADVEGLEDGAA